MQEREKDALVQMLKAAAKATQLRASLLNYTELQQVRSCSYALGYYAKGHNYQRSTANGTSTTG